MIRAAAAGLMSIAMVSAALAEPCPSTAVSVDTPDAGLVCSCAAPVDTGGSIYGTDRYTADSSVCTAAVHAGKVPADKGGDVTLFTGGGCGAFNATTQNAITSMAWGAYDKTFAFATPLPECAKAAAPAETASATPEPTRPPGPAPKAGPKEWQARADRFAAALPKPLDGWDWTKPRGEYANDSMNGRYVQGIVWYKKGGHTTDSDLLVTIMNMPDAGPYWDAERLWTDEAYRTAKNATKGEFAGREAVIVDPQGDESVWYRASNGLYVQLSRLKSHTIVTEDDMATYAKALDWSKIEKLPVE